jgi:hypothetical protein
MTPVPALQGQPPEEGLIRWTNLNESTCLAPLKGEWGVDYRLYVNPAINRNRCDGYQAHS